MFASRYQSAGRQWVPVAVSSAVVPALGITNLGQPRQVSKCQAEDVRGVYLEVDGLPVDALVVACYSRRLGFDFALDLSEVVEPAPWDVQKLPPFLLAGHAGRGMWNVHFIVLVGVVSFAGQVYELEDERPPGNDAAASREKVPADNIFEHG